MGFKLSGSLVIECTMQPLAVIKALNVIKERQTDLIMALPVLAVEQFGFECAEERFHAGVVVTISGRAHARNNLMRRE